MLEEGIYITYTLQNQVLFIYWQNLQCKPFKIPLHMEKTCVLMFLIHLLPFGLYNKAKASNP